MANQLKMALSETILTLHRLGGSQRRIASELNIDRETVGRRSTTARDVIPAWYFESSRMVRTS